ncbi:hypothetical protein D3C85_1006030 [compost metagenome]
MRAEGAQGRAGAVRTGQMQAHADQGHRLHLALGGAEQVQAGEVGAEPFQTVVAQKRIDAARLQRLPPKGDEAGLLDGDGAAGQTEAGLRRGVQLTRQLGVAGRLHQVQGRDVGLGLGGEVGAGDLFDLLAGAGLALDHGFQPGQGRATEIDHVAAGGAQAQFFQKGAVVQQTVGMGVQPGPHLGPVKALGGVRREVQGSAQAGPLSGVGVTGWTDRSFPSQPKTHQAPCRLTGA